MHDIPLPPPPPPPPPPRDQAQYSTRADTGEFARRGLRDVEELQLTESDRRKLQVAGGKTQAGATGTCLAFPSLAFKDHQNDGFFQRCLIANTTGCTGLDWATLYDRLSSRVAMEQGMIDEKQTRANGLWDESWCLRSGVPPRLCYYPQMPLEIQAMALKARERITYEYGKWTQTGVGAGGGWATASDRAGGDGSG